MVDIDFERMKLIGVIDLGLVHSNWKLLMENFIEPYHVQFVHAATTTQPLTAHYIVRDRHCLGSAVDIADGGDAGAGTLAVSSQYLTLFPSFVFGRYFPNQVGVHLNVPLGPGQTRQRRAIYTTDGSEPDEDAADRLKALWAAVHGEDHAICERLQKGRASSVALDGGLLSPHWESSVRDFQEHVLSALS